MSPEAIGEASKGEGGSVASVVEYIGSPPDILNAKEPAGSSWLLPTEVE